MLIICKYIYFYTNELLLDLSHVTYIYKRYECGVISFVRSMMHCTNNKNKDIFNGYKYVCIEWVPEYIDIDDIEQSLIQKYHKNTRLISY